MITVTYFFRGNLPPLHRLLFPIIRKGSFYMHFPTARTAHTIAFDGPVVDHCLEWKITLTANVTVCAGLITEKGYENYIITYSCECDENGKYWT